MSEEIKEYTLKFHKYYERLEPNYGYETRKDTKEFDFNSNNGKLMYATVSEIISPLLQKVEQLEKENKELNLELSGYRQAILNDDNLMGLKLKIDKAITYIKTGKTFENKNTKKVVDTIQNDLLNILNKGSEE